MYSSLSDPDPHGSALILIGWIRIRIQNGKNYHKIRKKGKKIQVLKGWMFSFESGRLLL
jgi:hypothetical protein